MSRVLRLGTIAVALAAVVSPLPAGWIEARYSRGVYPALQSHLTHWSNAVPVAVTDLLIGAAIVATIVAAWRLIRARRTLGTWRSLARAARALLVTAAAVYLVFMVTWGLNYRREPLGARLDFDRARVTRQSVIDLARRIVGRVNALHARAHAEGWPTWEALPVLIGPSFERVQRELGDGAPAVPGVPKWSLLTYYFERAGVSGMTDPFALEVVVDRSHLGFERPFVAAHEWAHLAGYAGEDEANFIAWLVCLQGPPGAEYSGDLVLLVYLLNALGGDDAGEIADAVGPGPRSDLRAMRQRASRAWPWLRQPAWWVYDRYLRANRVERGVQSYGAALELMVGTKFEPGWIPTKKDSEGSR